MISERSLPWRIMKVNRHKIKTSDRQRDHGRPSIVIIYWSEKSPSIEHCEKPFEPSFDVWAFFLSFKGWRYDSPCAVCHSLTHSASIKVLSSSENLSLRFTFYSSQEDFLCDVKSLFFPFHFFCLSLVWIPTHSTNLVWSKHKKGVVAISPHPLSCPSMTI